MKIHISAALAASKAKPVYTGMTLPTKFRVLVFKKKDQTYVGAYSANRIPKLVKCQDLLNLHNIKGLAIFDKTMSVDDVETFCARLQFDAYQVADAQFRTQQPLTPFAALAISQLSDKWVTRIRNRAPRTKALKSQSSHNNQGLYKMKSSILSTLPDLRMFKGFPGTFKVEQVVPNEDTYFDIHVIAPAGGLNREWQNKLNFRHFTTELPAQFEEATGVVIKDAHVSSGSPEGVVVRITIGSK